MGETRSRRREIRLTPSEDDQLALDAEAAGKDNVSDYMRERLLGVIEES